MPKAKTIDRLEYTKNRRIVDPHAHSGEEHGAVIANNKLGVEICPTCGAKLIHESGCVRCTCGWSRC